MCPPIDDPPVPSIDVVRPTFRQAKGPLQDPTRPAVRQDNSRSLDRKVAVLICHGIGQQVPFANIDLIASGLVARDAEQQENAPPPGEDERPRVRFARLGRQWLPRAELHLAGGDRPTEVHVYEAYWAPLTEGKVSAADVTRFLLEAGFQGLRYGLKGSFDRRVLGKTRIYPIGIFTLLALVVAFAVLLSVLVLYGILALLALLRLLGFVFAPGALDPLASGLSSTLATDLLRSPLLLSFFVIPVIAVLWLRGVAERLLGWLPRGRIIAWVIAAVLVVGALCVFLPLRTAAASLQSIVLPHGIPRLDTIQAVLTIALAAITSLVQAATYGPAKGGSHRSASKATLVLFATLVMAGWTVLSVSALLRDTAGWMALDRIPPRDPSLVLGRGWFLAFLLSAGYVCIVGRGLYIQYLGDAAAYLSSHKLSKFGEIRTEIRKVGFEAACAIYGARTSEGGGWEYDEVVMAGHSLGSVVIYDSLNAVLNEDLVNGGALQVERRTRALVTFGSPLDKTAFIFRTQVEDARFREALAAAVQPLVEPVADGGVRRGRTIPWRNIHSIFDPISGPLGYYDPPGVEGGPPGHRRVDNRPDLDSFIFGKAHNDYWKNPELNRYLHATVTSTRAADG